MPHNYTGYGDSYVPTILHHLLTGKTILCISLIKLGSWQSTHMHIYHESPFSSLTCPVITSCDGIPFFVRICTHYTIRLLVFMEIFSTHMCTQILYIYARLIVVLIGHYANIFHTCTHSLKLSIFISLLITISFFPTHTHTHTHSLSHRWSGTRRQVNTIVVVVTVSSPNWLHFNCLLWMPWPHLWLLARESWYNFNP